MIKTWAISGRVYATNAGSHLRRLVPEAKLVLHGLVPKGERRDQLYNYLHQNICLDKCYGEGNGRTGVGGIPTDSIFSKDPKR